jgi:predicted DsbA family dithiol-disulfide isomerase
LKAHFGEQIVLERRSFLLRPVPDPTVRFQGTYREAGWRRAAAAGAADGVTYRMWAREDYPTWSLPAQEAAKGAAAQGAEAFERVHLALFEAFFAKGCNIAVRDEVLAVAQEAGLDLDRFRQDFDAGRFRAEVLREDEEARGRYGITAIPTVIFLAAAGEGPPEGDQVRLTGAVPEAEYAQVLTSRFGLRPMRARP